MANIVGKITGEWRGEWRGEWKGDGKYQKEAVRPHKRDSAIHIDNASKLSNIGPDSGIYYHTALIDIDEPVPLNTDHPYGDIERGRETRGAFADTIRLCDDPLSNESIRSLKAFDSLPPEVLEGLVQALFSEFVDLPGLLDIYLRNHPEVLVDLVRLTIMVENGQALRHLLDRYPKRALLVEALFDVSPSSWLMYRPRFLYDNIVKSSVSYYEELVRLPRYRSGNRKVELAKALQRLRYNFPISDYEFERVSKPPSSFYRRFFLALAIIAILLIFATLTGYAVYTLYY